MRQVRRFYGVRDELGELSNFAPYPIVLDGRRWPTSEHYFQAQKFVDRATQEEIRKVSAPGLAAEMGRDRRRKLRRDWERVKRDVMRRAVEAKFRQHPELRELLLATGDAVLVEHTDRDAYWATAATARARTTSAASSWPSATPCASGPDPRRHRPRRRFGLACHRAGAGGRGLPG